eukprot:scaffold3756_cov180-Ochromonas_danica.AAC.3
MFLFSSFRETSTNLTYDKVPTNVLPDSEDLAALREMEVQRLKWSSFLASCRVKNIWEEDWLWHNRVNPPLASGPIQKKFMLLFSQKVKTRQQVKGLIRSGVPPELRGHVWYACSGAEGKRRQARPEESYSHLVNLVSTLEGSQIAVDIEKDLLRTFPERINEEHEVPPCQQIQGQHGGGSSGNGHHHHHQTNKEKSSDEDLSGGDGSNSGLSPEDLTANTNNHNNSNNNGNNHNSGSGSMTEESAQISSSEFLIRSAFGYRWLRSVPVGKVELLREKFSQLFAQEEESNKRNALLGSPTSPKSNNNNNNNSNSNNSTNGVITVRHSSSSGSNGSFSPKGQQYTPTASPQPDHHKELNDNNNNNSNSNREITLDRARRRTVRTRKSELMLIMQYLHDLASQTLHEENFAEQVEEFARQLHADSTASSSSSSNGQQGGVKEDLLRKGLRATTTTPPSRSRTVEEEEENDDDDLEDDVIGDDEVVNAFKKS